VSVAFNQYKYNMRKVQNPAHDDINRLANVFARCTFFYAAYAKTVLTNIANNAMQLFLIIYSLNLF